MHKQLSAMSLPPGADTDQPLYTKEENQARKGELVHFALNTLVQKFILIIWLTHS